MNIQTMHQEAIHFGNDHNLFGILTQPKETLHKELPIIILLNAGLVHRIGPNRIYVNLAYELANESFTSFRFDFSGIGDSENTLADKNNDNKCLQDTMMAIDYLWKNFDVNKFVLVGICSGADIAFQAALKSENILAICLINSACINFNKAGINYKQVQMKTNLRYYKKNMFNLARWKKILTWESSLFTFTNLRSLIKNIVPALSKNTKTTLEISDYNPLKEWYTIVDRGTNVYHILSEGSSSLDLFNHISGRTDYRLPGPFSKIKRHIMKDADHVFTPIWSQEHVISLICNWLKELYKDK
jgi:alpha/beta superfamily hydrolase